MSDKTPIEWTDSTWNPVTGCTKISAGCDNCYAARFSNRFAGVKGNYFETGFQLTLRENKLKQPLMWKNPRKIFVNSMSDLFHKDIPTSFIDKVFEVMEAANWHSFQVLTKRSSIMLNYVNQRYSNSKCPDHIWLGVSVENQQATSRLEHLRKVKAAIRFISIEPLIAPVGQLNLNGISWVIVGGESGPKARTIKESWVTDIRDQCLANNVFFFFKQWGGFSPKSNGRSLEGQIWNDFPNQSTNSPTNNLRGQND